MDETRRMLELTGDRFEMPEPAMDRMLRRRERKERGERIAAGAVGLGVATAGIAGAVVTLRVAGGISPASEGRADAAAAEGGALVLPTVAIWTAIVVLGLAVLATVRFRARFVHVDVDDVEGREPGGGAAPARSSVTATGIPSSEGGSEMDSKPKADVVGLPRAEMPEIRFDDGDIRRTNRWLIGAVVVLALAVVALGAALIVQAGSEETPTKATPATPPAVGLADPAAVALVDGFLAAHNTNDADTVEQQYVADAVFTSVDAEGRSTPYEGRDAVWSAYNELFAAIPDLRVERVSPILQFGDVTSFTLRDSNQTEMMWVLVWRDGKIAEQWNVFHDDHPVEAG